MILWSKSVFMFKDAIGELGDGTAKNTLKRGEISVDMCNSCAQ